jgi:hypothetical protein
MSDCHENRAAEATDIGTQASASWQEPAPADPPGVAPRATTHRDGTPFDLAAIAAWLPRLGAVLWLDRSGRRHHAETRATIGARGVLLLDHPALAVLARCTAATAHTQVTTHGPREWVSFRDAEGVRAGTRTPRSFAPHSRASARIGRPAC